MLLIASPGQGSQMQGYLKPWVNPETQNIIDIFSSACNIDINHLGCKAGLEEISLTENLQPLLCVSSIISGIFLLKELQTLGINNIYFAGHSVGEIASAYLAGVLSLEEAANFISFRSKGMSEASNSSDSSMAAVITKDINKVLGISKEFNLQIANINSSSQIVLGGKTEDINSLISNAPKGFRVIKLNVQGAFHTSFMQSAFDKIQNIEFLAKNPKYPIFTNNKGEIINNGADYIKLLKTQIISPVYWKNILDKAQNLECKYFIELSPAGVLTGIAKKELKKAAAININTPEDISKTVQLIKNSL